MGLKNNTNNKPPPPPTTEGKSATQPTCNCPQEPLSPCDVEKLEVKVVTKAENMTETGTDAQGKKLQPGNKKDVVYSFQTDKPRSREPVTGIKDGVILNLLARHSFVIETIGAPPPPQEDAESKPSKPSPDATVTLELARAHYYGKTCAKQLHPYLQVHVPPEQATVNKAQSLREPGAKKLECKDLKLHAPDWPWDEFPKGENSFFALFEILISLFQTLRPAELTIGADACGIRPTGETSTGDLSAAILIYRGEKWNIGLKVPPLGTFEDKREARYLQGVRGSPPTKGDYSRSQKTSVGNLYSHSTSTERKGDKTTSSEEIQFAGKAIRSEGLVESKGQGHHTSQNVQTNYELRTDKDGKPIYGDKQEKYGKAYQKRKNDPKPPSIDEQIKERLKTSSGFELVLARDGREVSLSELGKTYKKYKKTYKDYQDNKKEHPKDDAIDWIKKSVNESAKKITSVKDFFKKVPQVGWNFKFDISVLAGTFMMEWGPNLVETPLLNGRYYPVEFKFKGKIAIEIINLKLSLSFGVEAKALKSELVLKIEGTLTLKAEVEHDINMDLLKPTEKFEVKSEAKVDLDVVGYVNVFGETLSKGKLSASTGLELKGYMEIGWRTNTCALKGVLKTKAITVTGEISGTWLWSPKINPPIEILPGADLHTFE